MDSDGAPGLGHSRPPTKGERQRQAILDALVRLLDTHSIADLTVGEIAAEAGVGRSGFYFYFDSKFAALAELYVTSRADLMVRLSTYKRATGVDVETYADDFLVAVRRVWEAGSLVLVATVQALDLDEGINRIWRQDCSAMADAIANEVVGDPDAKPSIPDVRTLVGHLAEMSTYLFYLDRLRRTDNAGTEQMLRSLKGIWMSAVWGLTPSES